MLEEFCNRQVTDDQQTFDRQRNCPHPYTIRSYEFLPSPHPSSCLDSKEDLINPIDASHYGLYIMIFMASCLDLLFTNILADVKNDIVSFMGIKPLNTGQLSSFDYSRAESLLWPS